MTFNGILRLHLFVSFFIYNKWHFCKIEFTEMVFQQFLNVRRQITSNYFVTSPWWSSGSMLARSVEVAAHVCFWLGQTKVLKRCISCSEHALFSGNRKDLSAQRLVGMSSCIHVTMWTTGLNIRGSSCQSSKKKGSYTHLINVLSSLYIHLIFTTRRYSQTYYVTMSFN